MVEVWDQDSGFTSVEARAWWISRDVGGEAVRKRSRSHRRLSGRNGTFGMHRGEFILCCEGGCVSCEDVRDVGIIRSHARWVSCDFFDWCDGANVGM